MNGKTYTIADDLSDIPTKELLKKLPDYFSMKSQPEQIAFLNWRFGFSGDTEGNFCNMADAYFDTALFMLEECINNNEMKKADAWIFPILFNSIHGIELYLKAFNSLYPIYKNLQSYKDGKTAITKGHHIKDLCKTAISLIKKEDKEIREGLTFILKFINYLYTHTDDMAFPRYPINNKKDKQFYNGTYQNIAIDLLCFKQWLLRVKQILELYTVGLGCEVDVMRDTLHDIMSGIMSDISYY